jgi:hypothetical protein
MSEMAFLVVATAAVIIWLYALWLLRRLYRTFREDEKKRLDRGKVAAVSLEIPHGDLTRTGFALGHGNWKRGTSCVGGGSSSAGLKRPDARATNPNHV